MATLITWPAKWGKLNSLDVFAETRRANFDAQQNCHSLKDLYEVLPYFNAPGGFKMPKHITLYLFGFQDLWQTRRKNFFWPCPPTSSTHTGFLAPGSCSDCSRPPRQENWSAIMPWKQSWGWVKRGILCVSCQLEQFWCIFQEFCEFRAKCGLLWCYDWVSIPMVYTQVVTLATYVFFIFTVIGRQKIDSMKQVLLQRWSLSFEASSQTIFLLRVLSWGVAGCQWTLTCISPSSPSSSSSFIWACSKLLNSWSTHLAMTTRTLNLIGSLTGTWRWEVVCEFRDKLKHDFELPGFLLGLWYSHGSWPYSTHGQGLLLGQAELPYPLHWSLNALQAQDLQGLSRRHDVIASLDPAFSWCN